MSAVDIIAVRQADGTLKSTSFYVLFNSRRTDEEVTIEVNGVPIPELVMVAHQSGEIYFSPALSKKKKQGEKLELDAQAGALELIDFNEEEFARDEAESKQEFKRHLAEEERQIRETVAEESWILDKNSPNSRGGSVNSNCSSASSSRSNSKASSKNNSPALSRLSQLQNGASPATSRSSSPKAEHRGLLNGWSLWGSKNNNTNLKETTATVVLNKAPTSEQLDLFAEHLTFGENVIKFTTVTSKQSATARMYLWRNNVRLIISDIDGTITKTDKRGLFYYKLGYDWTHDKVVDLYKSIADNGYQFVYLTARSMKVQTATKSYLEKIGVPNGPVLCAPHDLFSCVTTEFWKTTAEGKLAHLNPLKGLFPEGENPMLAGFGNRVHDHFCYKTIGIPPERIYIINRSSEVTVNGQKTNYETLMQLTQLLFPMLNVSRSLISFSGEWEDDTNQSSVQASTK